MRKVLLADGFKLDTSTSLGIANITGHGPILRDHCNEALVEGFVVNIYGKVRALWSPHQAAFTTDKQQDIYGIPGLPMLTAYGGNGSTIYSNAEFTGASEITFQLDASDTAFQRHGLPPVDNSKFGNITGVSRMTITGIAPASVNLDTTTASQATSAPTAAACLTLQQLDRVYTRGIVRSVNIADVAKNGVLLGAGGKYIGAVLNGTSVQFNKLRKLGWTLNGSNTMVQSAYEPSACPALKLGGYKIGSATAPATSNAPAKTPAGCPSKSYFTSLGKVVAWTSATGPLTSWSPQAVGAEITFLNDYTPPAGYTLQAAGAAVRFLKAGQTGTDFEPDACQGSPMAAA
ncbi:MAG TPA: hypothetical protein VMR41_00275 [Patescibacteria group bacterium]|nr:hypothetical protein [Patescibacteria group bacterium]